MHPNQRDKFGVSKGEEERLQKLNLYDMKEFSTEEFYSTYKSRGNALSDTITMSYFLIFFLFIYFALEWCIGFRWVRVSLFYSSLHVTMVLIYDENSVNNPLMF